MIRPLTALVCLVCAALVVPVVGCSKSETEVVPPQTTTEFDLVFLNGTIIDGSGNDRVEGDVGIHNGRIVAIGNFDIDPSVATLDISGLVIAPGFIDVHSHADLALSSPETAGIPGFLKQGVTTAVYGVDGFVGLGDLRRYIDVSELGVMGINFMSYIGHNGVRRDVMGVEDRAPSDEEMTQMKAQVQKAMELGAVGLSSGLMYLPGKFATSAELVELAKVVSRYGGVYESHVRDPAAHLLESHQECLDIAHEAGVSAHPAHVKAVGGNNFGKGPDLVKLIEAGIERGQDVTVDLYPYDGAYSVPVLTLLYPGDDDLGHDLKRRFLLAMEGALSPGDITILMNGLMDYWRSIAEHPVWYDQAQSNTEMPESTIFSWVSTVGYESMRIVVSSQEGFEGRMVVDLAGQLGITPFELFRQMIVSEGEAAVVTLGAIQEEDIRVIMKQPWAMIASDGAELNPEHPRGRGTFPRLLGRYVREWGVLTLEEAVFKISGLPAQYLKIPERGMIREGAVADLVIFDPDLIIDMATWSEPGLYADGIEHVMINGIFALKNGAVTEKRPGQYLHYPVNKD